MQLPRQFGQELDQNVRRGRSTSAIRRNQAMGMLKGGTTVSEVAMSIQRSERSVRHLRLKYLQTDSDQDKPRSGSPPVLFKQ
jgi:hypothetical protein